MGLNRGRSPLGCTSARSGWDGGRVDPQSEGRARIGKISLGRWPDRNCRSGCGRLVARDALPPLMYAAESPEAVEPGPRTGGEVPGSGAGNSCWEQLVPEDSRAVLVVEDDTDLRTWMVRILRRGGHAVLEAPDGWRALHVIEQHEPTDAHIGLILLDLLLPFLSGV